MKFRVRGKSYVSESLLLPASHVEVQENEKANLIKEYWYYGGSFMVKLLDDTKKKIYHENDIGKYLSLSNDEVNAIVEKYNKN